MVETSGPAGTAEYTIAEFATFFGRFLVIIAVTGFISESFLLLWDLLQTSGCTIGISVVQCII
jgi:hypothetical protein